MLVIGLTGGIASGKSTVAETFRKLGVPVIDADQVSRDVVEPGEPALEELTRAFGREIFGVDGRMDRAAMRKRVFNDTSQLKTLESILHPYIIKRIREQISSLEYPYCILMSPIMTRTGMHKLTDRVLVVDAGEQTQIHRVMARDNIDEKLARRMLKSQETRQDRLAVANDVIINEGRPEDLPGYVRILHKAYLELAHHPDKQLDGISLPDQS